jgi:hypothetical protein
MADEVFELAFEVTGEGAGPRAFENLRLRELEAKQETARLAAELRKLQQSGEASEAQIEETARAMIRAKQSAAQYAAEARNVQRATSQATRTTQASTQAQTAQAVSALTVATRIGQVGTALGSLGSFLGQSNPELAKFGQGLGTVASAASAGGSAFGPWGAAVGAAVGVAATLATQLNRIEVSADEARAAMASLGEEIGRTNRAQQLLAGVVSGEELADGIETAGNELRGLNAEIERRTDLIREAMRESGARSVEEFEAWARANIDVHGEAADAVRGLADAEREVDRLSIDQLRTLRETRDEERQIMESAQRRADAYSEQNDYLGTQSRFYQSILGDELRLQRMHREGAAARVEATREQEAADRRGAAAARERRREEEAAFSGTIGGLVDFSAPDEASIRADLEAESAQEIIQIRQDLARWSADLTMQSVDAQIAAIDRLRAKEREAAESVAEKIRASKEQALEAQREAGQITKGMWDQVGGSVLDAAGTMFKFLAEGAEGGEEAFVRLLDQFLQATAIEYGIRALGEFAQAAAAAASLNPAQAVAHATAGGLALAVAAATGIGAAAIQSAPAPSGGGGGGGGGAQLQPSAGAGAGPAEPFQVNIYATAAVFTDHERQQMIAAGAREQRRSGGRRLRT